MIQQMYMKPLDFKKTPQTLKILYLKFRLSAIVKKNQTAQRNGE